MKTVEPGRRWAQLHAAWYAADIEARGLERAILQKLSDSLSRGVAGPTSLRQVEEAIRQRKLVVVYRYELDAFLRRHFEL